MTWMINMLDRDIDPTERISLYYTLHWITQVWRTSVRDETIRMCFIKSTIISLRTDQMNTSGHQSEDLQLGELYAQVTERLPGAEIMKLDENIDVKEPHLADIIVHLSEGKGGSDAHDQDDEDKDSSTFTQSFHMTMHWYTQVIAFALAALYQAGAAEKLCADTYDQTASRSYAGTYKL